MVASDFRRDHTAEQFSGYDNAPITSTSRHVEQESARTSAPRVHAAHEPEPTAQPAVIDDEDELPDYGELVAANAPAVSAPVEPSATDDATQPSTDGAPRSKSFINDAEQPDLQPTDGVPSGTAVEPTAATSDDFGPSR